MKVKNNIAVILLMITGLQTAWAQKIILHMSDSQKVEFDISQVDSITFKDDEQSNIEEHEYVDLGLPSGTLWATCNVGANNPEEYGDYFAWGETEPKGRYDWDTYKYCMGEYNTMTKYCPQSDFGYNGFTDDLTELLPEDDAATAHWGSNWQMPSMAQFQELFNSDYTTTEWTTQNGIKGRKITSKVNGKNVFMPAAGFCAGNNLNGSQGIFGYYWSRSLCKIDNNEDGYTAYGLYFDQSKVYLNSDWLRLYGQTIRPVQVKNVNNIYCTLPAKFVMENVYQAPAIYTSCNSMGEFCIITYSKDGKQFIFKGSSNESSYVNLTALNGYSGFHLGLSGLIVGLPNIPEKDETESKVVCFDLACPNCYENYNITKPLTLHNDGTATCASCKRTYDLNNIGFIASGKAGKALYRYRVSYVNNTLVVNNK